MSEKSIAEIVDEIRSGVTGAPEKDKTFLISKLAEYKNHPQFDELSRLIAKLMVRTIPKEATADLANKLNDHVDAWIFALQGVRNDVNFGRLEKALADVEELAQTADKEMQAGRFKNDSINKYFSFNNPFEEMLYSVSHGPEITIRNLRFPFSDTYFLYGTLLYEFGRFEEAKEALIKGIRWNPSHTEIQIEYAESLRELGDLEGYKKFMTSALNLSYRPEDIARAFRGLGFYYIEKEMWDAAIACEYRSIDFQDHANARNEIGYIGQITGKRAAPPTPEEFDQISKRYGFPDGASKLVLGVAYSMGKQLENMGNTEGANYFYGIYYAIAKDNKIKDDFDKSGKVKEKRKPFWKRRE